MAKRSKTPADAAPSSTRPTASYVLGLYRTRLTEGDEVRLRSIAATFRTLVRMQHKIPIPRQYRAITKGVKTPFVRDAWQRITSALTHERPIAHFEPLSPSKEDRNAANLGERWVMAAVERMTKELKEDVIYEAPRALVRDGESVIKIVHKPDAWATFPERLKTDTADEYSDKADRYKKKAGFPIAWRVIDRLSMVFGDGEFGDSWALEFAEYPRPYLCREYGMAEDDRGRVVRPEHVLGGAPMPEGYVQSSSGTSQKLEYWSADWWHVVIDGSDAPGFPKPNPFSPRLPYVRAKADSDSESPLYSLLFIAPSLDAALTMKLNWAYLGAYPNPVTKTVPTPNSGGLDLALGEDNVNTTLVWRPGKAIDLPAGKEMAFLVPPPVGKDLDDMITIYRGLIDVAGIPAIMRSVGGESGYDTNQKYAAALSLYRRLAGASARQLEEACELMTWIVEHRIKQTVFVLAEGEGDEGGTKWLGLGADVGVTQSVTSVDRLGPLTWTFKPQLPTDKQAVTMIAVQGTNAQKPLFSRRWALQELLNVEDPEAMADEIAVEDALDNDPTLKASWTQAALREANLLPAPPPAPAAPPPTILGPDGQPLPPSGGGVSPFPPGQIAGGLPSIPGLTMSYTPAPPQGGGGPPAVSVNGGYPGQPSGQGPPLPQVA